MTDEEIPSDGIVRTALQLLPVPQHGPSFWAELDDAIAATTTEAADDGQPARSRPLAAPVAAAALADPVPTRDPSTDSYAVVSGPRPAAGSTALVPPALRRGSNAVLAAMAVAAAVVVVVAAGNLVSDRRSTEEVANTQADAAAELDALIDGQQTEGVLVSMSADDEGRATEAVLAWLAAVTAGDADTAWAALGEASRSDYGSASAFEADLAAVAAAHGPWSEVDPDQVLITPLSLDDGELVAVVTFVGEVEGVDGLERRADAFPVRVVDGEVILEAFAAAGVLELVVPEGPAERVDRPVVAGDGELVLVVPDGAAAPVLRLDDGDTVVCGEAAGTELIPMAELPGRRCSWTPDGGIPAGDHTLTVAFLAVDGSGISADSVLFAAA